MRPIFILILLFRFIPHVSAQKADSTVMVGKKMVTLSEVVVNNRLDVHRFIDRIKNDSSFYKAFRNLHILQFSAINDIRLNTREGELKAFLHSRTRQTRSRNCRKMQVLEEQTGGDIYDSDHEFNYYTAQLYASLFFTRDSVCGENNIVKGRDFSTSGKSGLEKHKEQLRMLFFNPGKKINGIPFISNKTAIFEDEMADHYDMQIDMGIHNNISCYIFKQTVKPGHRNDVIMDEMITWFDDKTLEVIGRNYTLSYDAGVYDFTVQMEVQLAKFGEYLVPTLIKYNGNWKVVFKKRERGVFTATLYDFQ